MRAAFGHAPRQCLARIVHGLIQRILLVATLGLANLDFVSGREGQGAFQKFAFGDIVAGEDQAGRLPRLVELADEGGHDFRVFVGAVDAREVGAVAPVLPGAEEEHLDTGIAAFLMDREHVGFFQRARIDALLRLNRR